MHFDWAAPSYRSIINNYLGHGDLRRPRGVIKSLAESLKCHSTFISQVLNERADFSQEQGLIVSRHFSLAPEEEEFFLTLLLRDRAGTSELKLHYQNKIDRVLESRLDLSPKEQTPTHRLKSNEPEYFGNWLYQTVHILTQVPRLKQAGDIAKRLGISIEDIQIILSRLEEMGLVQRDKNSWRSTTDHLHLSKHSPVIRQLHSTWKTKILADLQNRSDIEGTRYSGVITITEKDFRKVRDILVKAIADTRKVVDASSAEDVFVLSIDSYKL